MQFLGIAALRSETYTEIEACCGNRH